MCHFEVYDGLLAILCIDIGDDESISESQESKRTL